MGLGHKKLTAIIAGFFLIFGLFWLVAIQKRVGMFSFSGKSVLTASQAPQALEKITPKYRHPKVKGYHIGLFWILAYLEVATGLFYFTAGVALLRRFPWGKIAALLALTIDLLFKLMVIGYMHFCAVPMALWTKNPNILKVYFLADSGFFSRFSGFVSGMMVYDVSTRWQVLFYIGMMGFLFHFFTCQENQG